MSLGSAEVVIKAPLRQERRPSAIEVFNPNTLKRKTLLEEFFPEADEVDKSLESIRNGLDEVARMDKDINSTSTPTWIAEKMKDELDALVTNIKTNAVHVIASLREITTANNSLDVNCVEYRIRKTQIAQLSLRFVELMARCEKMRVDLEQCPFPPPSKSSKADIAADQTRRAKLSKSVDDLRGAFAEVALNIESGHLGQGGLGYGLRRGSCDVHAEYDCKADQLRTYSFGSEAGLTKRKKMTTLCKIVVTMVVILLLIFTYSFYFLGRH